MCERAEDLQPDVQGRVEMIVENRLDSHILMQAPCVNHSRCELKPVSLHIQQSPRKPVSSTKLTLFHGCTSPTDYGCYFSNYVKKNIGRIAVLRPKGWKPEENRMRQYPKSLSRKPGMRCLIYATANQN